MIYVGIDPATSCGWAVLEQSGERLASGVWSLGGRDAHDGARWSTLWSQLDGLLDALQQFEHLAQPPIKLAYERVEAHGGARKVTGESYRSGASAAHCYGGLVAVITLACHERQVHYSSIPVASAKRAAGKGNLSKAAMVTAAKRRWRMPERPAEDEADALWIAEALRLASA